jgi:hypothetical protein
MAMSTIFMNVPPRRLVRIALSAQRRDVVRNSAESLVALALKTLALTPKSRGIGGAQFDRIETRVHSRACALSPSPFQIFVSRGFTAGRFFG